MRLNRWLMKWVEIYLFFWDRGKQSIEYYLSSAAKTVGCKKSIDQLFNLSLLYLGTIFMRITILSFIKVLFAQMSYRCWIVCFYSFHYILLNFFLRL